MPDFILKKMRTFPRVTVLEKKQRNTQSTDDRALVLNCTWTRNPQCHHVPALTPGTFRGTEQWNFR